MTGITLTRNIPFPSNFKVVEGIFGEILEADPVGFLERLVAM